MRRRDDEARNTKPVKIPSLPPPTAPHPIVPARGDDEPPADDGRARRSRG